MGKFGVYIAGMFVGTVMSLLAAAYGIKGALEGGRRFTSSRSVSDSIKIDRATRRLKGNLRKFISTSKGEKYAIGLMVFLMAGTANNLRTLAITMILGLVLGFVVVKSIGIVRRKMEHTKKLREIAILFEAVELYVKAGYSLVQALRAAKILTTLITPSIDKCLGYWGSGPQKALEVLKEDLGIKESDALIMLMMHLESVGTKEIQGVLQREAYNIERIQRMKTEIKIAHRPMIFMIYKVLPAISVVSIILGSLLYRAFNTLQSIGVLGLI